MMILKPSRQRHPLSEIFDECQG